LTKTLAKEIIKETGKISRKFFLDPFILFQLIQYIIKNNPYWAFTSLRLLYPFLKETVLRTNKIYSIN